MDDSEHYTERKNVLCKTGHAVLFQILEKEYITHTRETSE